MGFSRQEYSSRLPFPSPGIFPTQERESPVILWCPSLTHCSPCHPPTPTPTTHPYMQDHSCLDQERLSSNSDLPRFPFHLTPFLHLPGTPLNHNMRCKMYHQGNECLQMAHPWTSQPPLSHSCLLCDLHWDKNIFHRSRVDRRPRPRKWSSIRINRKEFCSLKVMVLHIKSL